MRNWQFLLWVLLAAAIIRLWLMPLPSSFWVDEMGTAFVVHYGSSHPSFAIAPQVPASIYYVLPRISEALFGFSEVSYRWPSALMLGIAIYLIYRIAQRLIAPHAGWIVIFACFSLRGFNYEAADARPYALGTCIAAASVLALIHWMDSGRWLHALLFVLFAALLWRVHLIFWPFYGVYASYVFVRLVRKETPATWIQTGIIAALLGALLVPVVLSAIALNRNAGSHVIAPLPRVNELVRILKINLVVGCGLLAFVISKLRKGTPVLTSIPLSSAVLIGAWWLCHPLCLFAYSWITGASVWVPRYLALAFPGIGLAAALLAARFLSTRDWIPVSAMFAVGVLWVMWQPKILWPMHHNSDWRSASAAINRESTGAEMPVICPSPFVEAKPPVWYPGYPLPSFVYSHLDVYRLRGTPYRFPFERSPEAEQYARQLASGVLSAAPRFAIYGGDRNVWTWRKYFAQQPEFVQWRSRDLGSFGDVGAVIFERESSR